MLFFVSEIVDKVRSESGEPFRPKVNSDACSLGWHELMTRCWAEKPESRPSFDKIKELLKAINGGK